jgi:outer membrane protein assembly factor BamB
LIAILQRALLGFAFLAGLTAAAVEPDWNQFRGPNGQGNAPDVHVPATFGPTDHLRWKVEAPPGHSSPVLWGDHLFFTAAEAASGKTLSTLAYDRRDGRLLWRQSVEADTAGSFHPLNSPASSTPAVDAERVYAYFGTYGVLCFDHAGAKVWERRFTPPKSKYGAATSPVLYGDTVILVLDSDDGASRLLALKRATGETAWERPRSLFASGWSTPMLFRHGDVEELVVLGSKRLTAYDPRDGAERWFAGGFCNETVGVPVEGDGMVFAGAAALGGRGDEKLDAASTWKLTLAEFDKNHDGRIQRSEMTDGFAFIQRPELPKDNPGYGLPIKDMDHLLRIFDHNKDGEITEDEWMTAMASFAASSSPAFAAFRAGATNDARSAHLAWEIHRGVPESASVLFAGGRLYMLRDGGLLTCLNPSNGAEIYRERIGATGQYIASPILAGDKLLAASVPGVVTVIAPGDTLRVLASNPFNEPIYATPAAAHDTLYIRTASHLYAIGE